MAKVSLATRLVKWLRAPRSLKLTGATVTTFRDGTQKIVAVFGKGTGAVGKTLAQGFRTTRAWVLVKWGSITAAVGGGAYFLYNTLTGLTGDVHHWISNAISSILPVSPETANAMASGIMIVGLILFLLLLLYLFGKIFPNTVTGRKLNNLFRRKPRTTKKRTWRRRK